MAEPGNKFSKIRPIWVALTIFIIVLAVTVYFLIERIPPVDITRTRMIAIAWRIREYTRTHEKLPIDIYSLPNRKGYDNSIEDGWGNEIKYAVTDNGIVILTSFGKDSKPGGEGEYADIIGDFNPKIENDYPFIPTKLR